MMRFGLSQFARSAAFGVAALAATGGAHAASFGIDPTLITLHAERPSATLRVTNAGEEPVKVQIRVVSWRVQPAELPGTKLTGVEQVQDDTQDIVLNPPIFMLKAKQTQSIRLGVRDFGDAARERAYRVILDEVPPADAPGTTGVRTLLRISLPLFLAPRERYVGTQWALRCTADKSELSADNLGNVHAKLFGLKLANPGADDARAAPALETGLAYVLSGQRAIWPLAARPGALDGLQLMLKDEAGERAVPLVIEDSCRSRR